MICQCHLQVFSSKLKKYEKKMYVKIFFVLDHRHFNVDNKFDYIQENINPEFFFILKAKGDARKKGTSIKKKRLTIFMLSLFM